VSVARVGRTAHELRPLRLERGVADFAEGSCLVSAGATRVLCTASVEQGVPAWWRGGGEGWVTAEYAMLPRATHQRTSRERGQVGGRTQEIQRLIGRSLRACVDTTAMGEWTIRIDCDVLQADGGTRTASITGGCVALADACRWLAVEASLPESPFRRLVAAISVGIVGGETRLDLDYREDSRADVDLNLVGLEGGGLIEVQGTGERAPFAPEQLASMVMLGTDALGRILLMQRETLLS
jgi:ribonuclease PH